MRGADQLVNCVVLIGVGITVDRRHRVMSAFVALSGALVHGHALLDDLMRHSLKCIKLIVLNDHACLNEARKAAITNASFQRCQADIQQNARSNVARFDQCKLVALRTRAILSVPDTAEAEHLLRKIIEVRRTESVQRAYWVLPPTSSSCWLDSTERMLLSRYMRCAV